MPGFALKVLVLFSSKTFLDFIDKNDHILSFLGCLIEVLCGGETYRENSTAIRQFVNGRIDVEGPLIAHVAIQTHVPSIGEPIFKQGPMPPPIFKQSLEESLQNCIIDKNGNYLNRGGTCIEECDEGQTLIIYDWSEGYCCCIYQEVKITSEIPLSSVTPIDPASVENENDSSNDSPVDCKISDNSEQPAELERSEKLQRIEKLIIRAFPNFIQSLIAQNAFEIKDTIKKCTIDENGKYTNVEGSCIGDCSEGTVMKVYDDDGNCCCELVKSEENVEKQEFVGKEEIVSEDEPSLSLEQSSSSPALVTVFNFGMNKNTEKLQNCMVDKNGHFLNVEGSCVGSCSAGKRMIIYDENEGFCCCAF
jgi:hypothetical protein